MTLKATVSMTYANTRVSGTETLTKEFTQTLSLSNPVIANAFTIADAASSKLYPGDRNHVSLSFESRGHNETLSTASLKLMNGENEVADYTSLLSQPTASAYTVNNLEIIIPSLSQSLALDDALRLVATVANADGLYKTLDITELVVSNPVQANAFTINDATNNKIYPGDQNEVTLNFSSLANTLNLSTVSLQLKEGDNVVQTFDIAQGDRPNGKEYNPDLTIIIPALSPTLELGDNLKLVATVGVESGLSQSLDITNLVLSNPVSGGTLTAAETFYPADASGGSVTFNNFTSAANALNLTSASLWLCYQDQSGVNREVPVNVTTPNGKTYSGTQTIAIPDLTAQNLNLSGINLNKPITLKARVSVSNDLYQEVILADNTTLKSHFTASLSIPTTFDNNDGFPVNVAMTLHEGLKLNGIDPHTLSSVTLKWKQNGDSDWNLH